MGFQSTSDDRHRSTQETKDNFSSIDGPFFCALFCCCKNIRSLIDVTTTKNKGDLFKRRTTTAREDKQWRCSSAKSNNNKNVPGWRDFWKLNYSNHFHNFLLHKLCACVWMLVLGRTKSARKKQTDTTIQRGSDIDKNRKNESRKKKVPSICILSILFGFVHNHHGPKFPSVLVLQRKPTVLVFPIDDGVWKTAEKTPHRWRHAVKSAMYTTFIKIAPSNHQTTNREKKSSQHKVEAAHSTQNGQHKLEIRKFDGEKWNGIKICVTCGCQLSIIWNVRVDWSLCLVCMFVFVHAYCVTFSTAVQPENKYIFVMMAMRKGEKKITEAW